MLYVYERVGLITSRGSLPPFIFLPPTSPHPDVLEFVEHQSFLKIPSPDITASELYVTPQIFSSTFNHFHPSALGRGPKRQNAKNVTELFFFTVFIHINDLEKVWKSRNEFKVVGFKVEKNGPCSRENEVKIFKKRKMAKNDFLRSNLGS